jgi:A/G-specific adenine glycosylase
MTWFADQVLVWFDVHGRKDLPWQHPRTPYRVWISEVMLQQTQVATVIPYFERFVTRFPDVEALARAELDDVLHLWTGLGYYARGRNLHAAARHIVAQHGCALPQDLDALIALPGIGASTAGAILAAGHGIRASILDGNVKRVLARYFAVPGYPGKSAVAATLWTHAETNTPTVRVADYTQAIMDLGATLCTRSKPRCTQCPVMAECVAYRQGATGTYPAPRPHKTLPVRRAHMYLIIDPDGRCLLERRPPTGLWGGLWHPPERAVDHGVEALLDELDLQTPSTFTPHRLPTFRHTFTHFHMDIEPVRIDVCTTTPFVADHDRFRWYGNGENEPLGLSAVAVRLLSLVQPTRIRS